MTIARKAIVLAAAIAFAPSTGVNAATTDLDAGMWRMIVLTGPTQVPVAPPAQVNSLDGPSTPTPPGHWMFIAAPHIGKAEYSEVRAARAFGLVAMVLHDAAVGCWETKYFYYNPRPSHLDPELKSVIGLPNFPSYTSGHSTFSGAAAEMLSYLFPSSRAEFERQKDEASISRLYGGIHYRSDLEVGKEHGKRLAGYTVRFAQTDGADFSLRITTTATTR
jgi:membrane-associated phospholipid phosphatase